MSPRPSRNLVLLSVILATALIGNVRPVAAQTPPQGVCMDAAYGGSPGCTANEAGIALVDRVRVGDGCVNPNDTATLVLLSAMIEQPNTDRYDIGIWVGLAGDPSGTWTALDGTQCARQILRPAGTVSGDCDSNPFDSTGGLPPCSVLSADDASWDGPYRNFDGDACGDVTKELWPTSLAGAARFDFVYNNGTDLVPAPYTISCRDFGNGFLRASTCVSWNVDKKQATCDGPLAALPGGPSKCSCQELFVVGVSAPNVQLTCAGDTTTIGLNESLTKTVNISNVMPTGSTCTAAQAASDGCGTAQYVRVLIDYPENLGEITGWTAPNATDIVYNDTGSGRLIWIPTGPDGSAGAIGPTGVAGVTLSYTFTNTKGVTTSSAVSFDSRIYWSEGPVPSTCNASNIDACLLGVDPGDPTATVAAVPQTASGAVCSSSVSTTPVTLASFQATPETPYRTRFDWSTATEVGTVGFDLFGKVGDDWVKLNDEPIPSQAGDSVDPRSYSAELDVPAGVTAFAIEDLDISGTTTRRGPFDAGETHGRKLQPTPIAWDQIRAEHATRAADRAIQRRTVQSDAIRRQVELAGVRAAVSDMPDSGAALAGTSAATTSPAANGVALEVSAAGTRVSAGDLRQRVSSWPEIRFLVDHDGIYRVTYDDLLQAGFDLAGLDPDRIGLSNRGVAVPIYVESGDVFGPGSFIEFYGRELHTLYSDSNVYLVSVTTKNPARIAVDATPPQQGESVPYYVATATFERNRSYAFFSPTEDPWFDTRLLAYTSPRQWSFPFDVDNLAGADVGSSVEVKLYGATSWPASPDHHVIAKVNGYLLADVYFDDIEQSDVHATVPSGVLREGRNELTLILPGDLGTSWDIVNLESFSVSYPRRFAAGLRGIDFSAVGGPFEVGGLRDSQVVAYREDGAGLTRLVTTTTEGGMLYSALLPGSASMATYHVASAWSLQKPAIEAAVPFRDITSGHAEYLVISHPDFIAGLRSLIAAKEAQGLAVRIVDVGDVYAQYSYGIVDPHAIKTYIAGAANRMGVRYVLLVGGDSYDYHNYTGQGALSFIPSLYTATGPLVNFAPADALFADVDDDGIPDVAIGRLPVRTAEELAVLLQKQGAYGSKGYGKTAVFAADAADPNANVPFTAASEDLVGRLSPGWSVTRAYLDNDPVELAKQRLAAAIDDGVALTSFVGHSGPTRWTYKGLFDTSDIGDLANAWKPTVVVQWGCWNTYFVSPTEESLAAAFLLSGERGAVAVLGATTLTQDRSENLLGRLVMERLGQPGTTLGDAVLAAKRELAVEHPDLVDVLLGWTLLGDPALQVQP